MIDEEIPEEHMSEQSHADEKKSSTVAVSEPDYKDDFEHDDAAENIVEIVPADDDDDDDEPEHHVIMLDEVNDEVPQSNIAHPSKSSMTSQLMALDSLTRS